MTLGAGFFGSEISNTYWSNDDYTHFDSLLISGNPYLFRLGTSGTVDVLPISATGILGSSVDSYSVGTGWDLMFAATLDDVPVLYFYDTTSGAYELYEVDSGGQIIGLADSGTQESGWTSFLSFQTDVP